MKSGLKNNRNGLPEPDPDLSDFYYKADWLSWVFWSIVAIILVLVVYVNFSQAKIFSQSSTKHGPSLMGARIGYKISAGGLTSYNVTDNGGEAYRVTDNGGEDYNVN